MPPSKKSIKKNKKGGGDNTESTISNFTSTRSPSPINITGSSTRSSAGIKSLTSISPASPAQASASPASAPASPAPAQSLFRSSKSRLLSVPAAAASAASAASAMASSIVKPPSTTSSGGLVIRYILVFIILAFLVLSLYLYLEKPKTTSIIHLYDPVVNFFNNLERKTDNSAVKKLEKTLNEKKVVNKIDSANKGTVTSEKKYKKKPIIPEADDATSATQMKPKSKAGFCYIGEDRGFRSCIEVGEGDVCMSGDIFPTQAICINPNLRE